MAEGQAAQGFVRNLFCARPDRPHPLPPRGDFHYRRKSVTPPFFCVVVFRKVGHLNFVCRKGRGA